MTNPNTPAVFDKIWLQDELHFYDKVRLEALAKGVKDGDKLLDVGGGRFGLAEYLAEFKPELELELFVLDFSTTARDIVVKRFPRISYVVDSFENAPFKEHYFDFVSAGEVIEHVDKPSDFVRWLTARAKIGGRITISTPNPKMPQVQAMPEPLHIQALSKKDLLKLVPEAEYEAVGNYHVLRWRSGQ